MDQFDGVSADYKIFVEQDPFRNHLHYPGVLKQLQLSSGDSVLDIGCGDGYFDQLLTQSYKAKVVGYDSSFHQIQNAKSRGIEGSCFEVATPETFTTSEKFTAAVSILVLPYAEDPSHLITFFQSAFAHTSTGSKFVSAVFNPHFDRFGQEVGSRIFEKLDALRVRVNFLMLPQREIAFPSVLQQFSQETYESSALAAGFAKCRWLNFKSDSDGISKWGIDFWNMVHESQPYQLFVAEKTSYT